MPAPAAPTTLDPVAAGPRQRVPGSEGQEPPARAPAQPAPTRPALDPRPSEREAHEEATQPRPSEAELAEERRQAQEDAEEALEEEGEALDAELEEEAPPKP